MPTKRSQKKPVEEEEEEEYDVETILAHRVDNKGQTFYLVKWLGYNDPADNTWEPEANLNCAEKLQVYRAKNKLTANSSTAGTKRKAPASTTVATADGSAEPRPAAAAKKVRSTEAPAAAKRVKAEPEPSSPTEVTATASSKATSRSAAVPLATSTGGQQQKQQHKSLSPVKPKALVKKENANPEEVNEIENVFEDVDNNNILSAIVMQKNGVRRVVTTSELHTLAPLHLLNYYQNNIQLDFGGNSRRYVPSSVDYDIVVTGEWDRPGNKVDCIQVTSVTAPELVIVVWLEASNTTVSIPISTMYQKAPVLLLEYFEQAIRWVTDAPV